MLPVIILSTHNMGLGVIRSLGPMGIPIVAIYYEKNDMGFLSKYVTEAILAPHPEKREREFIDILLSCKKRFGQCLIIPADDATLYTVAKNKELLEKEHLVACSGWDVTQKFLDKKHTYAVAETIGVAAPRTRVPKSRIEIRAFCEKIGFPCLIKPCYSHRYFERFRKKLVKVRTLGEAYIEYDRAQKAGIEVMIQEFIPGDDCDGANYNSYFVKGQPVAEFTARKVRLSPMAFGVPGVVSSKRIPEIIEPGRQIIKALGLRGYSCMEFKRDSRDGRYKLMEVNGRYNRSTLLANRCGLNFPWVEYQNLVLGQQCEVGPWRENIFWIDEFRDIYETFVARGKGEIGFWEFMKPYMGRKVFAAFDRKDLRPFVKRAMDARWMGQDLSKEEYLWKKALRKWLLPQPKPNTDL